MSTKPAGRQSMTRRCLLRQAALVAATGGIASAPCANQDKEPEHSSSTVASKCKQIDTPMRGLSGKVAFITGGSSGIGLGIAQACTEAGMKVVITYRKKEQLDAAMAKFGDRRDHVHAVLVDVTQLSSLNKALEQSVSVFEKVHLLVNNAGIQNSARLGAISPEDWDRMMAVNVGGVFNGIRTFLPHIKEHGEGGQIVTTSSILGLFTAGSSYAAYCASKFAVVAMMESLRAELADVHIGVSVLCPGITKSNLEEGLREHPAAVEPLEVGRRALNGVRNNDLYILTHPEFEPLIRQRFELISAGMPPEARPLPAREIVADISFQNSIYTHDLAYKRCAPSAR